MDTTKSRSIAFKSRNIAPKVCCVASVLLLLLSCTSNTNDPDLSDNPTTDPEAPSNQNNANQAGVVSFELTSFSSASTNRVRRLPTDETPVLKLAASNNEQPFASVGRGSFYASCQEYQFDYVYKADARSGRNRLELGNVEQAQVDDRFGCDSSTNPYTVDAATLSLPVFSQNSSLLSDQPESQLVVYGENSELLTFKNTEANPTDPKTLALTTTDWILAAYRIGASSLAPVPTDNPISIRFSEDGQVQGTSPCHTINGEYEQQENQITFSNVWIGGNNCALEADNEVDLNAVDRLKSRLSAVLQGPVYAIFESNRLYLSNNDIALVLTGRALAANETRLVASILTSGEYPQPDNFDDPINQSAIQLVQQQDVLNSLWNSPLAHGDTLGSPPTIDFDRSLVLYLRMGFRPHLGESMTVRSASTNDDYILIEVNTSLSDFDDPVIGLCGYDTAIAHPFSFVLIEGIDSATKEIRIVEHQTSACSGLVENHR